MFELGECFAHGKGVSFVSAPPRAVARDFDLVKACTSLDAPMVLH